MQEWKDGKELQPEKMYTITLKYFIAFGKDGFLCFKDPSVLWIADLYGSRSIQNIVFGALEQLGPGYIPDPKRK